MSYKSSYKRIQKYFATHPDFNSAIHLIAGIGIGILITYPFIGPHPIRWSVVLLSIALLGHLYPLIAD